MTPVADPELLPSLLAHCAGRWGGTPEAAYFAAGRINLIGAHVDYHGGAVLPMAIDRGIAVAVRRRTDGRVHLSSRDQVETGEYALDALPAVAEDGWCAYPVGILRELSTRIPLESGLDLAFAGNLPVGSGLSSSAALLVATATAVSHFLGRGLPALEIARLAHHAETNFVGVPCGIMDPFASALAQQDHVLYLDCRQQSVEALPLPLGRVSFCVFDSMTPHALRSGRYRERVEESTAALASIRQARADVRGYPDLRPADLDDLRGALNDLAFRRARHVVGEMERVRQAREALRKGDLLGLGDLISASHRSSRRDYEISTARLDCLQEAASRQADVYGARVTGAGFGGSVLALVRAGREEEVLRQVRAHFRETFEQEPDTLVLHSGPAPGEVELP